MKKSFVMLLINLKICKINECEKVNEKIKSDIRENVINFDREIISIYNIDFENVVTEKTNKVTNEKTNV